MASSVTRSRGQPHHQEQQSRARWTSHLTNILASLMVDQVHKGNKKNNFFGKEAWNYICDEFYKKTGLKWDKEQLKNRCAVMRRMYVIIKSLLDGGGGDFIYDEAAGTVTASDEVWLNYLKEHPDAETLKSCGCPIYKELCIIFSEPATNGKHDHPAEHRGTPNFPQEVASSSESEEAYDAADVQEIVHNMRSTPYIRKRGRKGVDDAIAGAILEMAAASKMRTSSIQQRNARYAIANCIKELDQLKEVNEQVYVAAVDLFDNPIAREIFLSLKRDKRLIWLHGKCRATDPAP